MIIFLRCSDFYQQNPVHKALYYPGNTLGSWVFAASYSVLKLFTGLAAAARMV